MSHRRDHDEPRGKKRPLVLLAAAGDSPSDDPGTDWASLLGDLSRPPLRERPGAVEWRVHDKTHLEFAIDYPLREAPDTLVWEAYFFVPESFRLQQDTYDKKAIYDDLWSYIRYAVPEIPFHELARGGAGSALGAVEAALSAARGKPDASDEATRAMRELRLFACHLRAGGVRAMRDAERAVSDPGRDEAEVRSSVSGFGAAVVAVSQAAKRALEPSACQALSEDTRTAARWVDEDVSLVLESLSASLAVAVSEAAKRAPTLTPLAEQLAATSVVEARHRRGAGYDSVAGKDASPRQIEHLEFRRHILKRFTSSVLWLSLEIRDAAGWAIHTLYAVAAATAMGLALVAMIHSSSHDENSLRYALVIVAAYVLRDRVKASLQKIMTKVVSRRFPDRNWRVWDRGAGHAIGRVRERAGFVPFRALPAGALAARRLTRVHPLEEAARPERVLWHQKKVRLEARTGPFSVLTEIFRLDLHSWLDHTDDARRRIVFADAETSEVCAVTAPRVYNVNVVYRLAAEGVDAPFERLRVVVSRKGIERIEAIEGPAKPGARVEAEPS